MAAKNRFPLVMKSVAAGTIVMSILLAGLYRLYPQRWLLSAFITTFTTCYHFVMRLLVGLVVPKLVPAQAVKAPWFQQRGFEPRLYELLRVKSWKANMPTYDPDSFSLKHNSLEQIVQNGCVAELVHEVIIAFSFVPLLFTLLWGSFPVFLITSILAALYDSIFVIMQRYNRPRLVRILKKKEAAGL